MAEGAGADEESFFLESTVRGHHMNLDASHWRVAVESMWTYLLVLALAILPHTDLGWARDRYDHAY